MIQGLISLIPVVVTIGAALITKKTFSSILYGIITGAILLGGGDLFESLNLLAAGFYKVVTDVNTIWILLIVVLFGGWTELIQGSGGVPAVSKAIERVAKTRKTALLWVWILSVLFFFDEYLNVFTVSTIMKKISDKFRIPREMLAYIINSTGLTICAIVPFSSWSLFMLGLMEKTDMTQHLSPIAVYIQTVPYIVYGWFTMFTVPLFAVGVLPLFPPMKKSESIVLETDRAVSKAFLKAPAESQEETHPSSKYWVYNLVLPIALMTAVTVIAKDMLFGLSAALILCLVLYIPQKLMKFGEYFEFLEKGMRKMFPVVGIILLAYTFQSINKELGLVDFIIYIILNYVPGVFLPVTIFVVIAFLSFTTGTFWVLAALTFPIVDCLAAVIGVNPFLCTGALISAIVFGGNICMYSDTVLLTGALTGVTNYDYFKTAFPQILVPFSLSAILYIVLGFMIA